MGVGGNTGHLPQHLRHLQYARCLPRWCRTSTLDGLFDKIRDGIADCLVACVTPELRDLMLGGDRAVALLLPGHRDTVRQRDALPCLFTGGTEPSGEPVKKHA